jgi:23S rRNA (uracil1939-C5)-methyltransferase
MQKKENNSEQSGESVSIASWGEDNANFFNPRKIKPVKRELVLTVEKYAGEGSSIGYDKGKVIFVRYAIPGERIKVNVYKETSDYAVAEPLVVLTSSPDRIKAPCPYFGLCGGCDYQMIEYENQVIVKKQMVIETFRRIGLLTIPDLTGIIKSPHFFNYRNTLTFKVNPRKNLIGFFRRDTKFIVDIGECLLAMPSINSCLYDIRHGTVTPPHNFKIRTSGNGDTVVNWIKTDKYEDREVFETIEAAGKKISFKISKDSFFQVNNSMIPLWLEKIISFLDPDGHEKIYDLYSGIGLITLFISFFADETVGVEIAKGAVEDAEFNLNLNNIQSNVKFIRAGVEQKLPEMGFADVMIVDPPRRGMEPDTIRVIKKMLPRKIIYSSCRPPTMARDIKELAESYSVKELHLIDMFPQTHHVELLALLIRKK